MDVAENLARVRERIAQAGGDPQRVKIVAVTKGFGAEAADAARAAGLDDLGENYAQELAANAKADPGGRWHMLGHVQRNKVKALAAVVDVWQSVDRPELVRALAAHRPGASIFVQVNVTEDPGRNGCEWEDAPMLVDQAVAVGLDVRGLMAVGPRHDPAPLFRRLVSLADDLGLPERSIGMSDDLEVAVAAGSTMVRIGTALFGPRPDRLDLRR
ncbi:MAG TPA: YggS family pyridoxal phosphate enzyme [Acidimicrobiales bacterium]|nr:YggS family pyridoxal phosphate enzyme [Acidimicrobiales bacterium]